MPEWEKPAWAVIHLFALQADSAVSISEYMLFYETMGKTLPCKKCRRHFAETILKLPVPSDHGEMFGWTVELHNAVNRSLGKREYSVDKAREFWEKRRKNHDIYKKIFKVAMALILGIVIGYLFSQWNGAV